MTIKYELNGYHPDSKQSLSIGIFDTHDEAERAAFAIDKMIQQVVHDSDMVYKDDNPWDIDICDITVD